MEISPSLFNFLLVLINPLHGYQIMQEVKRASGGELTMGAGTCYGLIARCLQEKLIVLVEEVDRKKIYQITAKGRTMLQDEIDRLQKQLTMTKTYLGDIYDQSIKI
jgi:DNA-binding PadR family transcriptional regulator